MKKKIFVFALLLCVGSIVAKRMTNIFNQSGGAVEIRVNSKKTYTISNNQTQQVPGAVGVIETHVLDGLAKGDRNIKDWRGFAKPKKITIERSSKYPDMTVIQQNY